MVEKKISECRRVSSAKRESCKFLLGPQTLQWVHIHARSTTILILLTNMRKGVFEWVDVCVSVGGLMRVIFLFRVCRCIWACAFVAVPNHFNRPTNVNNLQIKNYQKVTPHNRTKIQSFRFDSGYFLILFLIAGFVFVNHYILMVTCRPEPVKGEISDSLHVH